MKGVQALQITFNKKYKILKIYLPSVQLIKCTLGAQTLFIYE